MEDSGGQDRRLWLVAMLVWLAAGIFATVTALPDLRDGLFPDPDDPLRLQQVRDWIGGQSWFDVGQHRMNPPDGAPMHWSRLVDIPIAAVILILRPLLGMTGAENAALIAVPLLTLGCAVAVMLVIARRLLSAAAVPIAILVVPVTIGAIQQMRPMRIDHHGWQIVLGLAAVAAMLGPHGRRAGMLAGLAASLWLHISLEGLPLAAAFIAVAGLWWVADRGEGDRLAAFTASLAGTSVALYALTSPASQWGDLHCDALSPPYLAALLVGAAGCVLGVRLNPGGRLLRLAVLGLAGTAALAALLLAAPQCAGGPFAQLDPVVRAVWYESVAEGLPIWRQPLHVRAIMLASPLIALGGTILAIRDDDCGRRTSWAIYGGLLFASILIAMLVTRGAAMANLLAVPGAVMLFHRALERGRSLRPLARMIALAAAITILLPGHLIAVVAVPLTKKSGSDQSGSAERVSITRDRIEALGQLPPSILAAPLDIGPAILVATDHRVIASGHHRNSAAMRDVIDIFMRPPAEARRIIDRRKAAYVVVSEGLPEVMGYARRSPAGLWGQLSRGRVPDWLKPVPISGDPQMKVWRVRVGEASARD